MDQDREQLAESIASATDADLLYALARRGIKSTRPISCGKVSVLLHLKVEEERRIQRQRMRRRVIVSDDDCGLRITTDVPNLSRPSSA